MNIVVVGSCADSSNLAVELNKRLQNSIIARIDMLKNIKHLLLENIGINTLKNMGTYIGDVETYDVSKLSIDQKKEISLLIETLTLKLNKIKKNDGAKNVDTFDALTRNIPAGTYSFIKIYSGAIDEFKVSNMVQDSAFISNSIFVVIKNPTDLLIPITVSKETLGNAKKNSFAFVECENGTDILETVVFKLLFESDNKTETKEEKLNLKHINEAVREEAVEIMQLPPPNLDLLPMVMGIDLAA